jgi:hypothetical protein
LPSGPNNFISAGTSKLVAAWMRASAACFGVANGVYTGCDAAAAVWFDCCAAWAKAVRAHDRAATWTATRDLDLKRLTVFDLMYFFSIMVCLPPPFATPRAAASGTHAGGST